jgi:lipase chaperone LimK
MGFLDLISSMGAAVLSKGSEMKREMTELEAKYESYSDEKLAKIVQSSGFFENSRMEKGVAFKILKERGFSPQEIRNL